LIFTKVFPAVAKGIPHYPAYLLLGIVLWTFFVEATQSGMNSILNRGDMIRKVNVPKYTIVISTTLSAFVTFLLNMVIVLVFMVLGRVDFRWNLIFLPFLLAELIIFCLGISFILSTLYVKFRDFSHIWDVVLQVLFYATPIIYVLGNQSNKFARIVSINPLAQIFQDVRSVMITPLTLTTKEVYGSPWGRWAQVLFVVIVLLFGAWLFRRSSKMFAEEL
jgi:ABC-2 type transport system permease protein